MPHYAPSTEGLTPGTRVGAAKSASKQLVDANPDRTELLIAVYHETADIWLKLGPTAVIGEGFRIREKDNLVRLETRSEVSIISSVEGPNEKQTITFANAKEGKFTLTYQGKTTGEIPYKTGTKEEIQTALEGLTTIGAGNVGVTGEAKGPFTVEFKGALKATDVYTLTADASKLVKEAEAAATITIATTVPGGCSVAYAEC